MKREIVWKASWLVSVVLQSQHGSVLDCSALDLVVRVPPGAERVAGADQTNEITETNAAERGFLCGLAGLSLGPLIPHLSRKLFQIAAVPCVSTAEAPTLAAQNSGVGPELITNLEPMTLEV